MAEQLSFEGFEPGGKRKRPPQPGAKPGFGGEDEHGFFLALRPTEEMLDAFEQLAQRLRGEHGLKAGPRPKELFHVSLFSLGRYEGPQEEADQLIARVLAAAATVHCRAFAARFDRVMSFGRGAHAKPLVAVGGEGLMALATFRETLGDTLKQAGLQIAAQAHFKPHLTLLYDRGSVPEQAVAPIQWTVREFFLIHSRIGQSRHEVLGRWPLEMAASS